MSSLVRQYCPKERPQKKFISTEICLYRKVIDDLTVCNDLLLSVNKIVVPKELQKETLEKIHTGHLGLHRCGTRANASVWWPGVNRQTAQFVYKIVENVRRRLQRRSLYLSLHYLTFHRRWLEPIFLNTRSPSTSSSSISFLKW